MTMDKEQTVTGSTVTELVKKDYHERSLYYMRSLYVRIDLIVAHRLAKVPEKSGLVRHAVRMARVHSIQPNDAALILGMVIHVEPARAMKLMTLSRSTAQAA
jgi:hypothetical protein